MIAQDQQQQLAGGSLLMSTLRADGQVDSNLLSLGNANNKSDIEFVCSQVNSYNNSNNIHTCSSNITPPNLLQRFRARLVKVFATVNKTSVANDQERHLFETYQQTLKIDTFRRASYLLALHSLALLLIATLSQLLPQFKNMKQEEEEKFQIKDKQSSEILNLLIVPATNLVQLILIATVIYRLNRQPARHLNVNQNVLLAGSAIATTILSTHSDHLVALQPTIMFIIYNLSAVDSRRAFAFTFVANLIHLLASLLLIRQLDDPILPLKNHCLRIKILGDCYYCVSGIPDMSGEHARRSVEMGLDIIDILGELAHDNAQDSGSANLNMRVGIHSGRVLCGVLGKRKWQFDVHSNDVKLANHTEQSGIPGRVHITEDTLKALDGRYQVEPANGHLRDTYIAQRNITTYFVIPSPNRRNSLSAGSTISSSMVAPNQVVAANRQQQQAAKLRFRLATQRIINALHFIRTIDAPFANLETPTVNVASMMQDTIARRCQIQDIHPISLKFKDEAMSKLYAAANGCSSGSIGFNGSEMAACQVEPIVERSLMFLLSLACILLLAFWHPLATNSNNLTLSPKAATAASEKEETNQPIWRLTFSYASEIVAIFLSSVLVYAHQSELNARRDFLWRQVASQDKDRMAVMRDCNRFIFFNLLPPHVASYFLEQKVSRSHMDLYHKSYDRIGVVFATISNFSDFYSEVQGNNHGLECLRLLNEIICDFDSILDDERFKAVDKIKTIGSTYMAAVGLFPKLELPSGPIELPASVQVDSATEVSGCSLSEQQQQLTELKSNGNKENGGSIEQTNSLEIRREVADYLRTLVRFVIEMKERLQDINEHSYNCFKLRVGINLGPVTAGVIGASKPLYDIWGNTVNVASRMESTAEPNKIQITDEVYQILKDFNQDQEFNFICRGSIDVKAKLLKKKFRGITTTAFDTKYGFRRFG